MLTLIDGDRQVAVRATADAGAVRVPAEDVRAALGWELTDEGLCGHGVCVPVADPAALAGADGAIDLAALARALDRPLALDVEAGGACLGAAARARAQALASLEAPDFALPDLAGRVHALSEQRGRKVLLVVWASW